MSKGIQISTVMLCYNRLYLSKKCLESYLDTISVPYELIIVNNASTDGTKEWLDGIKGDRRIRNIIHTDRNNPAAALNAGLEQCSGRFLHVMENDYIYISGWDRYTFDCFSKIPNLGQLCISVGPPRLIGEHLASLVYVSRGNVVSSSVFPREILFKHNIKWANCCYGKMPADTTFSSEVKKAGYLVAWPDRPLAMSVGFSEEVMKKDPYYYIEDYKLKLRSSLGWRSVARNIIKFRIDPNLTDAIVKLIMLYRSKYKKGIKS